MKTSKSKAAAFAAKICRRRIELNMTQGQFARKLGLRQQKISEWENGKRLGAVFDAIALLDAISTHRQLTT